MEYRTLRPTGDKMENDAASAAATDSPYFLKSTSYFLFSAFKFFANGTINFANGNYAHKAFIETGFSHIKEAKEIWMKFRRYSFGEQPDDLSRNSIHCKDKLTAGFC